MPLVFGAFGETSEGVDLLISALAEAGAEVHWRRMKAKKEEHAHGALMWLLRRRWGMIDGPWVRRPHKVRYAPIDYVVFRPTCTT